MRGFIGYKVGMTRIYDEEGNAIPVSIIKAGPCVFLENVEKEGYQAVKLGFLEVKEKALNKPILGYFKKLGIKNPVKYIKEFRDWSLDKKSGEYVYIDEVFKEGEKVNISGYTKGKGFAGVMKRWGFSGGPASHGSKFHRGLGSTGQHTFPGKTWKGKKMPGRLGNEKVTIKNLMIVKLLSSAELKGEKSDNGNEHKDILLVKGAIPGKNRGIVIIYKKED